MSRGTRAGFGSAAAGIQNGVGVVAEAGGVGVETIRYYQRRGLLELPDRTGGVGLGGARHLDRLGPAHVTGRRSSGRGASQSFGVTRPPVW